MPLTSRLPFVEFEDQHVDGYPLFALRNLAPADVDLMAEVLCGKRIRNAIITADTGVPAAVRAELLGQNERIDQLHQSLNYIRHAADTDAHTR